MESKVLGCQSVVKDRYRRMKRKESMNVDSDLQNKSNQIKSSAQPANFVF
jgi:hypothetical protein